MAKSWNEWNQPLKELDEGVQKLEELAARETNPDRLAQMEETIAVLKKRRDAALEVRFSRLGPWEEVLMARAESRPYTLDYIAALFTDFEELSGDRRFGDDKAIVGGFARFRGKPVVVLGHQKGRNLQERTYRNFAMSKPEGYRKAIRLFQMADRFGLPVVTFVDTPAADPGVESESRGISEAIAASMMCMFGLRVTIVSTVIGEGGSGGAIGIAIGNKVLMQEHAIYSVIPPEGCAAILWRDPGKGPQAAAALRLTSRSAIELGLVDEIVKEPFGGADRDPTAAAEIVGDAIARALEEIEPLSPDQLKAHRYERFRAMGRVLVSEPHLA